MEVPKCSNPAHSKGKVVRAGWQGTPPHRRQRWKCVPSNGDPSHRFTELLPREEARASGCATCGTALEPWEGQNGAREYHFMAAEIAHCLALIARGQSYRKAAEAARIYARRVKPWQPRGNVYSTRKRNPARDGQIAANWVDAFTEVIAAGELPTEWPRYAVALDGAAFVNTNMGSARAGMSFNVLAAVGYEKRGDRGRLWAMTPAPRHTTMDWAIFLSSLSGEPELVVADQERAIETATGQAFALNPPHYHYCEDHLRRNFLANLPRVIKEDPKHPIMRHLPYAFQNRYSWDRFEAEVLKQHQMVGMAGAQRWMRQQKGKVLAQLPHRPAYGPYAIGATEAALSSVKEILADRHASMTNLPRARKLLKLVHLDLIGKVDEVRWTEKIRRELIRRRGWAPKQRPHDDPKGTWSLVA